MGIKFKLINEKTGHYIFDCPGCKTVHGITTIGPTAWKFNNSLEKPTVTPSILANFTSGNERRCHSYITDGKIKFLGDCYHELKNKTVELPDYKD